MDIFKKWKRNIQQIKWESANHQKLEYSNEFLDRKIEILTDFFHLDDLSTENIKASWDYNIVNPSSIWLIYLLSQNNLGSFYLVLEICNVIEFFNKEEPEYLRSKLLLNNGRINKKTFRNDFFEVWLNYKLINKNIPVKLSECYRNPKNQDNEGYDSVFRYKNQDYIIECIKLQSWHEEILKLTFSMLKRLQYVHKKLNEQSKPHFDDLHIFINPTSNFKSSDQEFNFHLSKYFSLINEDKDYYNSSSSSFKDIHIVRGKNKILDKLKRTKNGNQIILTSKFEQFSLVDKNGKETLDLKANDTTEKLRFNLSSKTKNLRSTKEFENHLLKKVKKKIDQHRNRKKTQRLIIAIELEQFKGINSFPIDSVETFKELRKKASNDIIIMIFYKFSQNNELKITSQTLHMNNDPFVKYIVS